MKIKKIIIFSILLTLVSTVMAQPQLSTPFDASVHVCFETAGTKEYRTVQYALFKTENTATNVMQQLEKAVAAQRGDNGMMELEAWDKAVKANKVKFRQSAGNGDFKLHAFAGMAVLVCSYLPEDELTIEDARFAIIPLKEGVTEYNHVFQGQMDKGTHTIGNVDVMGTNRDTITIKAAPAIDDGKNLYFTIHVELPEGYGSEYGRLTVQPMSVDCQTEDTIDYIRGVSMEGVEFHKTQNKRMLFDYKKYDKVAPTLMRRPMFRDEKIYIDTTLVYQKPDPRRSYKIPYSVDIADLNHIYFHRTATTGSCNNKNIYKFLDLGVAAAKMDIEEFSIEAESNYDTKNQDLRLKFQVGTSQLLNDSVNEQQLQKLIKELQSYGDQLMEVSIEATASPDGNAETNRRLAAERTRVAVGRVRQYLGKTDVIYHTAEPHVFTWDDVAKERAVDTTRTEDDILESMRVMRVTYRYEKEHVMDAAEVTQAYYRRKPYLLRRMRAENSGQQVDETTRNVRDFSDGDYYNLYNAIKDSIEQDTITLLAYHHITRRGGYEQVKFSQYVANRMAMLNQKRGKPDASVLAPFINKRLRTVTTKDPNQKAQKNRREVLINQIITYFQLEERDSALSFCDYWFAKDDDPKVQRLRKYITFKEGFIKYATHQLSPEKEREVLDAMNYVISCAPENKAVLFTEARDILNVPHAVALALVDSLPDNNPKKWYLRGILEADKEEKNPSKDVPLYLAYFHHSFELEPQYKWYYFYDGQISDELRAKNKYSKKNFARYNELFANNVSLKTYPVASANPYEIELSGDDDNDNDNVNEAARD